MSKSIFLVVLTLWFVIILTVKGDFIDLYNGFNGTFYGPHTDQNTEKEQTYKMVQHICSIVDLGLHIKPLVKSSLLIVIESKYFENVTRILSTCTVHDRNVNQYHVLNQKYHVQALNASTSPEELSREILSWKSTSTTVFITILPLCISSIVMNIAATFGFYHNQFIWIVINKDIALTRDINDFPNNFVVLLSDEKEYLKSVTQSSSVRSTEPGFQYAAFVLHQPELKLFAYKVVDKPVSLPDRYKKDKWLNFLKVVTIIDPPFIYELPNTFLHTNTMECPQDSLLCWQTTAQGKIPKCCVGFCIDMLIQMKVDLNVKELYLYLVEDTFYGGKVNGVWNGMIADILNEKADIIIAPIIANSVREQAVDFSNPYLFGGMAIATTSTITKVALFSTSTASYPFTMTLWIVIFMLTVIPSIVNYFIERGMGKENSFTDNLLCFVALTFQRDVGGKLPKCVSANFILIIIATCMLVIMSTYTAVLTANSVTKLKTTLANGFNDPKLTLPSESFPYGVENNTSYEDKFRTSTDPVWNRMYYFMKRHAFNGVKDGIQQLKDGKLKAIISDIYVLQHYMRKDTECRIQIAGDPISDVGYGVVVKKGSPLKQIFTQIVLSYKQEFKIQKWKQKWLKSTCKSQHAQSESEFTQTDWYYFRNCFYITAGSAVAAMLLLLCEFVVYKLQQSYGRVTIQ